MNEYDNICETALVDSTKIEEINYRDWLDSPWKNFFLSDGGKVILECKDTGIEEEVLKTIGTVSFDFYTQHHSSN